MVKPDVVIVYTKTRPEMERIISERLARGYELHTFGMIGDSSYALMINYFRRK